MLGNLTLPKLNSSSYLAYIAILILLVIFIGLGFHIFNQFIKSDKKKYVDNKEYIAENRDGDNDNAVIYFFYTTWCPHSTRARTQWDSFKDAIGNKPFKGVNIIFEEVDCEKNPEIADTFKVEGYPTIKLVTGNKTIDFDAKPTKDTLIQFLEQTL